MNFDFSDEQLALRDLVREFLSRESPPTKVRAAIESDLGYDPTVWREMGKLGLLGVAIPERYGGLALGMVELARVQEEIGGHAYPGPYFASAVLATSLIETAGSEEQKQRWLPKIASGELIATVALLEEDPTPSVELLRGGTKRFVPWAQVAGLTLVVGRGGSVTAHERAARVEQTSTIDPAQRDATVLFEGRGEPLPGGPDAVQQMLRRAYVAASAEMLGAARRCMEMSVEYAKSREQFGQPIGSFQAVKHLCAEMLEEVEHSHAATYYAAWAQDAGADDAELAASVAKSFVSESARKVCGDALQVHGGIGFTWEFDLHLYLKRAKHYEPLWGDADFHRERILELTLAQRELVSA